MRDTGHILVNVSCDAYQGVHRATLSNERVSGVIDRLAKTPGIDLRQTVPVLFTRCPAAHLATLDASDRATAAITEDERREADGGLTERAIMLEALLENLHVFIVEAARLLDEPFRSEPVGDYADLRGRFGPVLHVLGGFRLVTANVDPAAIARGHSLIDELARAADALMERAIFGMSPDVFLETVMTSDAYDAWIESGPQSAAAALVRRCDALSQALGAIDVPLLPGVDSPDTLAFADEMFSRLRNERGFDMAPVWQRSPALTGSLSRQATEPLVADIRQRSGLTIRTALAARLFETAAFCRMLRESRRLSPAYRLYSLRCEEQSGAVAMVQTAQGLLTHATGYRFTQTGLERFHAIVSPTEWQFAPEGAGQQALNAALRHLRRSDPHADDPTITSIVRLALFPLDPCVPLDVKIRRAVAESVIRKPPIGIDAASGFLYA